MNGFRLAPGACHCFNSRFLFCKAKSENPAWHPQIMGKRVPGQHQASLCALRPQRWGGALEGVGFPFPCDPSVAHRRVELTKAPEALCQVGGSVPVPLLLRGSRCPLSSAGHTGLFRCGLSSQCPRQLVKPALTQVPQEFEGSWAQDLSHCFSVASQGTFGNL